MAAMCALARRPAVLAAAQTAPSPPPPLAAAAPPFDVRPSQAREDLQRAAWLRADAYYADKSVGRFKSSFVKQFAGQELYSLLRRTQGAQPECITLVAAWPAAEGEDGTDGSSSSSGKGTASSSGSGSTELGPGNCLGTLDVRLLDPANQAFSACSWPDAVPTDAAAGAAAVAAAVTAAAEAAAAAAAAVAQAAADAAASEDGAEASSVAEPTPPPPAPAAAAVAAVTTGPAAYVSNVVVAPAQRGLGLGRQLVAAGLVAARQRWGCGVAYCHVETDNEAALALYRGAGFVQLGGELAPAEEGLAKRLLLCRQLGDA